MLKLCEISKKKPQWKTAREMDLSMYAIEIFYSEEDEGFIAIVPELPGCSAFGETEERALNEVKIAMQLWLETAKEIGREIPVPQKRSLAAGLITVHKRMDLQTILEGIIKEAGKQDLDKLEKDIEEEGNRIAREKYEILADHQRLQAPSRK